MQIFEDEVYAFDLAKFNGRHSVSWERRSRTAARVAFKQIQYTEAYAEKVERKKKRETVRQEAYDEKVERKNCQARPHTR